MRLDRRSSCQSRCRNGLDFSKLVKPQKEHLREETIRLSACLSSQQVNVSEAGSATFMQAQKCTRRACSCVAVMSFGQSR